MRKAQVNKMNKHFELPDFELSDALCAQTDPELFFPDKFDNSYAHLAKKICAQCPVQIDCLDWAIRNKEEHGIWGGTTPRERQTLIRIGRKPGSPITINANRGAAPKTPRRR